MVAVSPCLTPVLCLSHVSIYRSQSTVARMVAVSPCLTPVLYLSHVSIYRSQSTVARMVLVSPWLIRVLSKSARLMVVSYKHFFFHWYMYNQLFHRP